MRTREVGTMTSNLGRLYATLLALVVFFIAWAAIAARPWVSENEAKTDPRLAALKVRELRLRQDAVAIKTIVDKRWATYRVQLAHRKHVITVRLEQQRQAAIQQARIVRVQSYQPAQSTSSYRASAPVVRVTPAAPATPTRSS